MVKKTKSVKLEVEKIEKKIAEDMKKATSPPKPVKVEAHTKRTPSAYALWSKQQYEKVYKPRGMKYKDMLMSDEFKQAWKEHKGA